MELEIKKVSFCGRRMVTDFPFRPNIPLSGRKRPERQERPRGWLPACAGIGLANKLHGFHELDFWYACDIPKTFLFCTGFFVKFVQFVGKESFWEEFPGINSPLTN